jgi:hypothetical protein
MDTSETQKRLAARRREIAAMRRAFPQLPAFDSAADLELERIFTAYVGLIPRWHASALPAQERSALTILFETSTDPSLKRQAARQIAESDIRAGIV